MSKIAPELHVTPITGSAIAWDAFIKGVASSTGRNLAATTEKTSEYARFILALETLRDPGRGTAAAALGASNAMLNHLHFSFLIEGPSLLILSVSESTGLHVVSTRLAGKGRIALVSGTLSTWKATIVEVCATQYSTDLRRVANLCISAFNQIGLQYIFGQYTRVPQEDGTFLLEYSP